MEELKQTSTEVIFVYEAGIVSSQRQKRGSTRLTFVVVCIAFVLVLLILVPKVLQKSNSKMSELDIKQEEFAEHQASIEFQQNNKSFTAVFDTENKKFVDQKKARSTVTPYGTSKEHQGMYILITVDENGNISSKWISP